MSPTMMENIVGRASTKDIGMAFLNRGSNDLDPSGSNKTREIISNLVLDKVVQVRYMHIAFGCISISMALWVVGRIWYDSWRSSKLEVKLRPKKWAFLFDLHPAESFPMILGLVIILQQATFVAIQSRALDSVFVQLCNVSSQAVMIEIFVTAYLHLVFGMEMTIRALKQNRPFAPKRRFTTAICCAAALFLTLATWVATRLRKPTSRCFGDLIFRSIKSASLGITLCAILIPSFLVMAGIIGYQLYRNVRIDQNERIAGTRMVYYLVLSAILYIMIMPFWIQARLETFDSNLTSSGVAEFVLFTSGAAIAFAHMFLRANAARTAIKPVKTPWVARRKFRLCGPSDLELMNISSPLGESSFQPNDRVSDIWARQEAEKGQAKMSEVTLPSSSYTPKQSHAKKASWPLPEQGPLTPPKSAALPKVSERSPISPKTVAITKTLPSHKRNQQSYSLFPGSDDVRLPATIYSPNSQAYSPRTKLPTIPASSADVNPFLAKLTSPSVTDIREASLDPPNQPWAPRHRRGSSADSSATVQIGIRFSAAPSALTATALRGSSTQIPKRPSLRAVIDNMTPMKPQPSVAQIPTSHPIQDATLQSPFNPKWDFPQSMPVDERTSNTSSYSDFAWLDTTDETMDNSDLIMARPDSSTAYIVPQVSQAPKTPQMVKPNRFEIEAITRSASARSRQGYKPPSTPDGPSTGFF
ncbi:hypothetical protein EJ08DRAFT_327698 [Tothia fuscella]|uniref:Uncharacterized protein n=1 Tax=Tothia fuscella TaxID=1048955 RepID=A0A9P4NN26_9PEZI|nr:hypothetical protein EJ08DRAFT_327698 [Tothia fuscella]